MVSKQQISFEIAPLTMTEFGVFLRQVLAMVYVGVACGRKISNLNEGISTALI